MTRIAFRLDKQNELTAVFIDELGTPDPHTRLCYSRVGQHGVCSLDWLYETRPAPIFRYYDLKKELKSVGYEEIQIVNRLPYRHEMYSGATLNCGENK